MIPERRAAAFEDCLQQVMAGSSLEGALAAYPDLASELRPMLEAALAASRRGRQLLAPRSALARSRARFLREAQRRAAARPPVFSPGLRFALAAFLLLAIVLLGSAGTAVLAAQSLPGEPLYSLKRLGEQTRLRLANDPVRRLELQQGFDQERLSEVDRLIQAARRVPVSFVGVLKATGESQWRVGDVLVLVSPQTRLEGDLQAGYYVGVEGETQADGSVLAARIWDRAAVFTGELQQMAEGSWLVSGVEILIFPQTQISGTPAPGSRLEMVLVQAESGQWAARVVVVRSAGLQPTVRPAATAVPPPSKVAPPPPTPTQEGERSQPTRTPKPTNTPEPTKSGEDPQDTPRPSKTPKPSKTPEPSESPEPTEEDDEEDEEHGTPTPTGSWTPTQKPSDTPRPSKTPDGDDD